MVEALHTHQSLIVNKVRKFLKSLIPEMAVPTVQVTIKDGLHEGVVNDLNQRSFVIGSGVNCDLILLDDCITEVHATVVVDHSIWGEVVKVITEQDDVMINNTVVMPAIPSPFESLPASVVVGGVLLQLDGTKARSRPLPVGFARLTDKMIKICVISLVFLGGIFGFSVLTNIAATSHYAVSIPSDNTFNTASKNEQLADSLSNLQSRIDKGDLTKYLTLTQTSKSTLLVTGTLPQRKLAAWNEIHRWFDSQSDGGLLTARVKTAPILSDFPAISSIKLNKPAQILFLSGQRVSIGDTVKDNWKVTNITSEGLFLERDGEDLKIGF